MKTTGAYKIWQIVYPIGMYYVVSSLVFFALQMLIGNGSDTYMLRQMLCAAVTIPFILPFYMQDKRAEAVVYGEAPGAAQKCPTGRAVRERQSAQSAGRIARNVLLAAVSAAALGIGVNNLIAMTPLIQRSEGFAAANEQFFGGQVVYELMGSCLLIPIAEELLYRGIAYKRLKIFLGVGPAVLLSALLFGIVHANLVQFLYAGVLGILLAFLLERTNALYAPIVGHIAANVAAVVRQETGWLAFSYEPTAGGIGFTVLMLGIAAVTLVYQYGRRT